MDELLATLVPALGRALLHFLWQGALVGVVAAICLQALRDARPQARYAVACLALLACALAPVATLLAPVAAPTLAPLAAGTLDFASRSAGLTLVEAAPLDRIDALLPSIVMLWAVGTGLLSLRLVLGLAWVRRLRHAAQPATQAVWQARLDALAVHFDLPRRVALRVVDGLDSPVAAGWWRPVVLLPAALLARMPADLVEALLAHELAHIRRHDYLVNLLQNAVEAVLFYHPVTWWLSRRIRIERELVADRLASEVACAPRRLALALSELSELQRAPSDRSFAPHLAPAAHGGQLMSRIRQLVRPARPAHSAARFLFPVLGIAAACVATFGYAQIGEGTKASGMQMIRVDDDAKRDSFALVHGNGHDVSMWGNVTHAAGLEAARRSVDGDFLWIHRGGKDFVVTDPAVLARARDAWRESEAIGEKMEALGDEMEVHGAKMEAIGARMEAASVRHEQSREAQAAEREMERLAERNEALAEKREQLAQKQEELAEREAEAQEKAGQALLEREQDALEAQQEALEAAMDRQSAVLDAESDRLDELTVPMDALSDEMDRASEPMDALGEKMDALGRLHDEATEKAEREMRGILDQVLSEGLARPVAGRASAD